jgi:hypothetical protein
MNDMSTKRINVAIHPPEDSAISVCIQHFDTCTGLLQGEAFDFHKFLELTSYVESFVLYDKLNVLKVDLKNISNRLSPFTLELIKNNSVFTDLEHRIVALEGKYERLFYAFEGKTSVINNSIELGELFLEATADEQYFSIPYHVPIETLGTYLDAVQIEESYQVYSLLFKAYSEMSGALRKDFEELQHYLKSNTIFVPPIMAMILSRCSVPANFFEVMLDMKERFAPLRKAFKEYEDKICDPSASLRDSLRAAKELKSSVDQLRLVEQRNSEFILSEWRDGLSLLPDINSLESVDTGLTKFFLGKPMEWLANRIKNRKIIGLFNLKKEFLNLREYNLLIKKLFSHELKQEDVEECALYWSAIDRLVHADKRITGAT